METIGNLIDKLTVTNINKGDTLKWYFGSKSDLTNVSNKTFLDTKKLENSEYTENETGGKITFAPLEEEPLIKDLMKYNLGKHDFFIP